VLDPKTSSATAASEPSGRSIGRKVTSPPPASVTTSSTSDGPAAAHTAAREPPGVAAAGGGPSARTSRGTNASARSGAAARTATQSKYPARVSAVPPGTATSVGMAAPNPKMPIDSPRRCGGTACAAMLEPSTVSTANPMPRTADTAISHRTSSPAR
jgi:hypothetical protein